MAKNINEKLNGGFDNISPVRDYNRENTLTNIRKERDRLKGIKDLQQERTYSNYDLWKDAKKMNRVSYAMEQAKRENSFNSDEDYRLTNNSLVEAGIPVQYWNEFSDAESQEHFDEIASNLKDEMEIRDRMSSVGGLKGFTAEAAASITDPVQLAIGVATGGLGVLAKGGTIAKLGTSYAIGTLEGAMTGAMLNKGLHTYTTQDMFAEALLSGAFSAGVTGAGLGIKKVFGDNGDALEVLNAERARAEFELREGNDINFKEEVDERPIVAKYADSQSANARRKALEEQIFNTDDFMNFNDTWKNQIFKNHDELDIINKKLERNDNALDEAYDTEDYTSISKIKNEQFRLEKAKFDKTSEIDSKSKSFEEYSNLKPIEQMQYVSDKRNTLIKEFQMEDPEMKMNYDIDNHINDLLANEKSIIDVAQGNVEKLNLELQDYKYKGGLKTSNRENSLLNARVELKNLRESFKNTNELKELRKISTSNDNVKETEQISQTTDKVNEIDNSELRSGGAAARKGEHVDFETYADKHESIKSNFQNEKTLQEAMDGVGAEINQLPTALKWLDTNNAQLNRLGGIAREFGELIYGRISTKKKTAELQKIHYNTSFEAENLAKQVNQYIEELNSVSEKVLSKKEAMTIGGKTLNGISEGVTPQQKAIADKFNNATQFWFDKYNSVKKLSVEMNKQMLQRELATKFQNILEKPIDGNIPLTAAYKNEFGSRATRNAGFSEARINMNEMLSIYATDKDAFDIRYNGVSNEFKSSLGRSAKELEKFYRGIAKRAIDAGLDDGTLARAVKENKVYSGMRQWNGTALSQADQVYGNNQLVALFKDSIEASDPNTKLTKAYKKNVESGKSTVEEATVASKGKPISEIMAEAIVNHNIRRHNNKGISGAELEAGFDLALNDMNKFINDYETSIKSTVGEEDFKTLRDFLEAEKSSAADKKGIKQNTSKRIEIDIFFQKQLENIDTGVLDNVSISQFLEMNSEELAKNYINKTSSHISFAKSGIKTEEQLNDYLNDLQKYNNDVIAAGSKPHATLEEVRLKDAALSEYDLNFFKDNAKQLWNGTSAIDYSNNINKALQYANNYNFMRMMGKMGIAQTSEWMEIAHQAGMSTLLKSIPAMLSFKKTVRNLKGEDIMSFGEGIESFGFVNNNHTAGFFGDVGDETAIITMGNDNSQFRKAPTQTEELKQGTKDVFDKGSRYAGLIGSTMDKGTRTMAVRAAFSELDKLTRFFVKDGDVNWQARQEKSFTKRGINEDTLTEYGLTMDELPIIKEAFDKYAVFDVSKTTGNRIILGLDLKSMVADKYPAFNKLREFSIHAQNEVVAPSTVGNSYKSLVNNQILKVIFQFRSYGLQSIDHKVRNKFKANNNVPMYIGLGAMGGFMSYSLNVLANAGKYENSDDYLKDRFTTSKILTGSFSRSVYAWQMPAILGTVEEMFLGSNYFDESTRTSGLSQGLTNNPFTSLLDNVYGVGKNAVSLATGSDDNAASKLINNSVNLLPFASLPFIGEGVKVGMQSGREYEVK